jgi:phenylacetate-coenzyme A ligase PaaK-like adenylate-forming protein
MKNTLQNTVFQIADDDSFNDAALKIFRYQYQRNKVYRKFSDYLNLDPRKVKTLRDIPFMPIQFFKSQHVLSGDYAVAGYFESSGTTSQTRSRHYYPDLEAYEESLSRGFTRFFGDVSNYCILALLPSYLEQKNASLIYMVKTLIDQSGHPDSDFYLYNHEALHAKLLELEKAGQKTLLIGVTFALLDLIEKYRFSLRHTKIIETGGMKGRRREIVREELHQMLCKGFGVNEIYSEYGMSELFSQAWSAGDGIFECPPWMKVMIRDVNDPCTYVAAGKTGGINVIDLANVHSAAFIATQDLGRMVSNNHFEVLGRFDEAEIRGCNLLVY